MEFRVLTHLPIPATAQKIITQFLRQPHPTAKLIQNLRFEWEEDPEVMPTLYVSGDGVRFIARETWPPTYVSSEKPDYIPFEFGGWCSTFSYNPDNGEPF